MGFHYRAKATIGVKVSKASVMETKQVKVRGCECEEDFTPKMKFCPACGKPIWTMQDTSTGAFDDDSLEQGEPTIGGLTVIGTDGEYNEEFIVCGIEPIIAGEGDGIDSFDLEDIDLVQIKSKLKAILEPKGLWDMKKFGLHIMMGGG
jgi:hypothetical protein